MHLDNESSNFETGTTSEEVKRQHDKEAIEKKISGMIHYPNTRAHFAILYFNTNPNENRYYVN